MQFTKQSKEEVGGYIERCKFNNFYKFEEKIAFRKNAGNIYQYN